MNVKRCTNGHYFDADKYQLCPHCGATVEDMIAPEPEKPAEKKQKTPFWKKQDKKQSVSYRTMPEKTIGKTFGIFDEIEKEPPKGTKVVRSASGPMLSSVSSKPSQRKDAVHRSSEQEDMQYCMSCGKMNSTRAKFCKYCGTAMRKPEPPSEQPEPETDYAFDFSEKAAELPVQEAAPVAESKDFETPVTDKCPEDGITNTDTVDLSEPIETGFPAEQEEAQPSLQEAVRSAVSGSDGKTVGFFSMGTSGNNEPRNAQDPVVGWLVCVKGRHFGESFAIAAGRNAIGRGVSNKIIFSKDNKVSREKHAWITYEPKKREFYIQAGEGSGLTYLNGEMIMESKKLQSKDSIEVGDGVYLLIPLCGEDFSWEKYLG